MLRTMDIAFSMAPRGVTICRPTCSMTWRAPAVVLNDAVWPAWRHRREGGGFRLMHDNSGNSVGSRSRRRSDERSLKGFRRLSAVTVTTGVLVAVAPVLPRFLVAPLLLAPLVAWSLLAAWALYVLLETSLRSSDGRRFENALGALGAIAIGLSVLFGLALWLVQTFAEHDNLIWNIDWRAALSHAQAISRFGNLSASLEYAGYPIDYHVGPAWLAAEMQRATGTGLQSVLFGLLPTLATVSILAGISVVLNALGVSLRTAVGSAGLAVMAPATDLYPLAFVQLSRLLSAENWTLGSAMMPNSYFGLAVGLSAVSLLIGPQRTRSQLALGATGLASVAVLKPQYFAGLGLLIGLLGLIWLARRAFAKSRIGLSSAAPRKANGHVILLAALLFLPFLLRRVFDDPAAGVALGALTFVLILFSALRHGVRPAQAALPAHLLVAAGTLLIGLTLLHILPGHPMVYGSPTIAIGRTGWNNFEFASIAALLLVTSAALSGVSNHGKSPVMEHQCDDFAWVAMLAIAFITIGLQTVSLPIRPELIERASRLGTDMMQSTELQEPLAESLVPIRLLIVACCIASMSIGIASTARWTRIAFLTAIFLPLLLASGLLTRAFIHPELGYEAVEENDLKLALGAIPIENSIVISSDIADPAQNYARPGNAPLLAAYSGHGMYLSELRWLNWLRPDAPDRLENLRVFFGSDWSPWHAAWLRQHGITYVLVDDRCPPAWLGDPSLTLETVEHQGKWTTYRAVDPEAGVAVSRPVHWSDIRPRYGLAECILPRRRDPLVVP